MSDEFDIEKTMRLLYSPWSDPEPGSELAADNALLPDDYASILSTTKLYLSLEHLRYFFEAKCRWAVSPPFTVLRTALMGAAQAYWVLEPDESAVRAERALRLAVDEMRAFRTYERDMGALDDEEAALARPGLLNIIDVAESEAQAAATALGIRGEVCNWRLSMTSVVTDVATAFIADARAATALNLLWRSKSAHAHAALFVTAMSARSEDITLTETGATRIAPRPDVETVVASAAMVTYLAQSAFQLYQTRRAAPVPVA